MAYLPSIHSQGAHFTVAQFFRLVKVQISEILMNRRASIGDKTDYRTYVAATSKEQNHDSANQADHLTAKIEPLRVLQVVTIMNRAGLETMLMNYYRAIDRTKVQFDFLVHRAEKGDYDDEIKKLGGRIYRFDPITIKSMPGYKKKMVKLLKNHPEYRVVHSHLDALSALPLAAAKKAKVPLRIAHSHSNNFDDNIKIIPRMILKRFIKFFATDFWGCSEEAIKFMFGDKILNSRIINNAIDLQLYRYNPTTRGELRSKMGLQNNFVIGHVGRFSYPKNHTFLIEVFKEIHAKNPSAVLLLAGTGELQLEIKEMVRRYDLNDSVRFLGSRTDIYNLVQVMDVFILPSRYEGLGMVLLEAQASGLACIASNGVIPKAISISQNFQFISLSAGPHAWALQALAMSHDKAGRTSSIKSTPFRKFDINIQAKQIQKTYLKYGQQTQKETLR